MIQTSLRVTVSADVDPDRTLTSVYWSDVTLSLLRSVVVGVHRPDDDDLLQAGGGGRRRPQLLHQSVEGVRVDGLLLVGFEGDLVGGADRRMGGLRLQVLDDGGAGGSVGGVGVRGVGGRGHGFGVGRGWFWVGWLAFRDGGQTFVFLGEFTLDEGHGMTGGQEDYSSGSLLVLSHFISVSFLLVFDHVLHAGEPVSTQQALHTGVPLWVKSSHVFLQFGRRHKTCVTFWLRTFVRSLTCVFSCVSDERGGDGERHAAQIALVRFLPRVSSLVISQRAGLSERLTADVTHVRLLTAVKSDVNLVVGRGGELEAAAFAGVRLLLAVVHPAVSDQLTLLSKTLFTVGATERLLACVDAQVRLQLCGLSEGFGAEDAGEGFQPVVDLLVSVEAAGVLKQFVALAARVQRL